MRRGQGSSYSVDVAAAASDAGSPTSARASAMTAALSPSSRPRRSMCIRVPSAV